MDSQKKYRVKNVFPRNRNTYIMDRDFGEYVEMIDIRTKGIRLIKKENIVEVTE